ncbi:MULTISPECIES: sensor histidine kinase [Arenibacter]|uniref:sensor histidine kinase n=1 Tax=Arenibacter TaxID=178469 RepID=UPI0013001561|nr:MULTISPECIES: histidine kinase [Arenibacter]
MFLLFFYLNVLFFGPVLLSDKKLGKYLFLIITSLIIIGIGTKLIYGIRYSPNLLVFAIHFMLTALLSLIYCYVRLKLKKDQLIFNLKLGAKDSELQLLKSQVNPHFLFNTLNTLYATALEENAPKTAESTAKLANLLRYMQNDITKDFIPLENEIKYLEDYITIQKLRCEVKPQVETIFKNCEGKTLSPGLLIPFVENAFKYGIDPSKPSKLKVSVICDASKINFECVNSYDDNFNTYYKEQGFGMGIKNAKQRLDLVYPKNYTLDISKANHIFTVKLNITSNK